LVEKAVKHYFSGYLLENNLMKIKDYYLSFLNENEDFFYVDNQVVDRVIDMAFSKKDDYVKIDFMTTYGKNLSLVTHYSEFKKWYQNNIDKYNDVFKAYAQEFISNSKEVEEEAPVTEIVDDDGNIMGNSDKPNNATNSMIGSKNNWDLEKVYKSNIPKSARHYFGNFGRGMITW
jgi:hypothetical protein